MPVIPIDIDPCPVVQSRPMKRLIAIEVFILATACAPAGSGDGSEAPGGAADATQGGPDVALADPGKAVEAPLTCSASVLGAVSTPAADIIYQGKTAEVEAEHLGEGCIASLAMTFRIDGGCTLALTVRSEAGQWKLTGGTFTGDSKCGQFWPADAMGEYTLDAAASTGAALNLEAVAADVGEACAPLDGVELAGRARFVSGDKTLDVVLRGLKLAGTALSKLTAAGTCPAPIVQCQSAACGLDAYGFDCGQCGDGLECQEGQCVDALCPPEAPFGTTKGTVAKDLELKDCDGNVVHIHDLCGAKAGYFYLFAGW